ncbi:MAG: SPASM domain-containing protein [Halanaerobiales bacterium]|nr:SPASM domain-containing protein [Halanaerobiales bacterium]
MGFSVAKPTKKISNCKAQEINTYSITPAGNVYKCPTFAGNSEIRDGYIDRVEGELKLNYRFIEWLDWDPFQNEKCIECRYLPICFGGCPYNDIMKNIYSNSNDSIYPERRSLEECKKIAINVLKTSLLYEYELHKKMGE